MKIKLILAVILFSVTGIFAQWQNVWESSSLNYNTISGWIKFDKEGENYKSRFYTLDTISFKLMESGFSNVAAYTYTFTPEERAAGYQIYSMLYDLNHNDKVDFYILSSYGVSPALRQSFKIFDISTGEVLLEKNDPLYYYSYPSLRDVDNNGTLECMYVKSIMPDLIDYTYEVYSTGTTGSDGSMTPIQLSLRQNYPNPFNPSTNIEYNISSAGQVRIKIFDITGSLVKTLVNEAKTAGSYNVTWNGMDDTGNRQATGVYIYELRVNDQRVTNKMVLLK